MDEISKAIKGARAAQRGRIYGSFSNVQELMPQDDSIIKGEEEEELEKARSGVYADTAENRRLGRVGQEFGKKTKAGEEYNSTLKKQASNASRENLKKIADSDKYPEEVRSIARAELKKREEREKKFMKKAEDDELNPFEKAAEEADVEKSDVMDALSYQGDIKVSKTGKEIKDQVDTVLLPAMTADLAVKEAEAEKELKNCGTAPTKDPDKWWTDGIKMDCGYKIYDWEETYVPSNDGGKMMSSLSAEDAEDKKGNVPENQEQANCRRAYNDIVRAICNIKVDIKACEILKTLKDEKQFELSPRQVLALRF